MSVEAEQVACNPKSITESAFNPEAVLPYGLQVEHIRSTMLAFLDFLGFVNAQLHTKNIARLESMLMPANFSSIVGEFMVSTLPKYCPGVAKNNHHNGHPDLIPTNTFPNDAVQHSLHGIEIKASRYGRGWQGHNPEEVWLMVFVFDCNRPRDTVSRPFQFVTVVGAPLVKSDWAFSGRSETSRRTITARVTNSGYQKLMANWIYRDSAIQPVK